MTQAPGTNPERAFDPRLYDQICFACGRDNPIGLHLRFSPDGNDGVVSHYRPRPEDQGFPGVIHGGVLAALLDESMAWAMFAADRALGVTAKMEMRYRRSTSPDGPLVVRGRVARRRGRRIEVEATIDGEDGARIVEASALFLRLPASEETRMLAAMGWDIATPTRAGEDLDEDRT